MKQHFLSFIATFCLILGLFVVAPAEARGGGFGCQRGGGASFCGTRGGTIGGCIRPGIGRGPICGPYRGGYHPRYGYGGYGGFGYGWGGIWSGGYLPCYDGGSPYICDIKPPPPPPSPQYIYQGGTVMREYGAARAPGMSPVIINEYKSSPGAKPEVIHK